MINAPITPGTHPHKVSTNTISTEPHPQSMTARGGKKIAKSALRHDIVDRGMNDEKYASGT